MAPGPGLASHLRRGKAGEDLALRHLKRQGLRLVERNYRSPWGEVDLVMRDGPVLVFVEVRRRGSAGIGRSRFASAAETVGPTKQRRLIKTAQHYLQRHPDAPARFDVVAITDGTSAAELIWIRDAFQS